MLAPLSRQAVIRTSVATLDEARSKRLRLTLYADRLELKGWSWFQRLHQTIPLVELASLDVKRTSILHIQTHDGTVLMLLVEAASKWREAIEACRICLSDTTALPDVASY